MSGIAHRALRDKFYSRVIEEYNTTKEEIVRILMNAGHQGFDPDDRTIQIYEMAIKAYFGAKKNNEVKAKEVRQKIAETADKAGEWRKTIFPVPYKTPCPISGCDGTKIFVPWNSADWSCSKGGKKHYRAIKTAEIWGSVNGIEDYEKVVEKATHFSKLRSIDETQKERQVSA